MDKKLSKQEIKTRIEDKMKDLNITTKNIIFPVWKDDREHWWFVHDVVGANAMWAIRQSPYPVPNNLTESSIKLDTLLVDYIQQKCPNIIETLDGIMFLASGDFIEKALIELYKKIPEIMLWNERRNGRQGNGFCSRYDKPSPDDDFIDLDALARNVKHTLLREFLVNE